MLFSPIDGTLLSGLDIGDRSQCRRRRRPRQLAPDRDVLAEPHVAPPGGRPLASGRVRGRPAVLPRRARRPVARRRSRDARPDQRRAALAIAIDPGSGNVFVPGSLQTAFTSSVGPLQPGSSWRSSVPIPATTAPAPRAIHGNPGRTIGVLSPDGGSPYVAPRRRGTGRVPRVDRGAVNGAACPVAMGCSYGASAASALPPSCNGEPTLWTCDVGPERRRVPVVAARARHRVPVDRVEVATTAFPGAGFYANCMAGGWERVRADAVRIRGACRRCRAARSRPSRKRPRWLKLRPRRTHDAFSAQAAFPRSLTPRRRTSRRQ